MCRWRTLHAEGYWADGDLRWLAGVNENDGTLYVNQESFDQLICGLQLPGLLGIAGRLGGDDAFESPQAELAEMEAAVRSECERLAAARYRLLSYIGEESEAEPETVEGVALV